MKYLRTRNPAAGNCAAERRTLAFQGQLAPERRLQKAKACLPAFRRKNFQKKSCQAGNSFHCQLL